MRHITIGILAHVDAGKTTLSEALLYSCGAIRKQGRVDHQDAFLDNFAMERERGITIFSKQAELPVTDELRITLLDTPGHVDFSAEMERTLSVLDYAILVINGADGVQGHTRTLWKLLSVYRIPTYIFINKMDQPGTDKNKLIKELQKELDGRCVEFSWKQKDVKALNVKADISDSNVLTGISENQLSEKQIPEKCKELGIAYDAALTESSLDAIAMCEETVMEEFLETGTIRHETISQAITTREVFPCFFGSALNCEGVHELLQGFVAFAGKEASLDASEEFGAKVYKITRDEKGQRLTHMKLTGGSLKVKNLIEHKNHESEKIDQIRIYSGDNYQLVQEVRSGEICAVTGLFNTYPGEGLGIEADAMNPIIEPVMYYSLMLPEDVDIHAVWKRLSQLEDENPLLRMHWDEKADVIQVYVMGDIELEVLKATIQERFDLEVTFSRGRLVYKETIAGPVEGVGHFEPLRHYAEVHLLMEPGEPGSGIEFCADCSEDVLDRNWQRLILTHLAEREHPGVLTGSGITDMKITVIGGRAHTKHTEGGDFRQATYRAVRQGLMKAENVLLEPYYEYRMELPAEVVGHAMSDIQRMCGTFEGPELEDDMAVITGKVPVAEMMEYQAEFRSYTHGLGRLSLSLFGYLPCHNSEEVIEQFGYDAEADEENPSGSVFCAHGAGYIVPWDQVESYMHVQTNLVFDDSYDKDAQWNSPGNGVKGGGSDLHSSENEVLGRVSGLNASEKGAYGRASERNSLGNGAGDRAAGLNSSRHGASEGLKSPAGNKRKKRDSQTGSGSSMSIGEDEIREIFERTYGAGSMDRKFYNKRDYDEYDSTYGTSSSNLSASGDGKAAIGTSSSLAKAAGQKQEPEQKTAGTDVSAAAIEPQQDPEQKTAGAGRFKDVAGQRKYPEKKLPKKKEKYLLVDGYNVIFAWEELNELSKVDLAAAREKLMDIMCNYQGYKQMNLILVFDAYKVQGNLGEMFDYHNIHVVYTKEAETADQYIEKLVHEMGRSYDVTVATSDGLEQLIVMGAGAKRLSARNLKEEIEQMEQELREKYLK